MIKNITSILIILGFIVHANAQTRKLLSFNTAGIYFFNYAGYRFNKPYQHNPKSILSLSYSIQKKKKGIGIDMTYFSFYYKFESKYPYLETRRGVFINVSYLYQLYKSKKIEINSEIGISTKISKDYITKFVIHFPLWSESNANLDSGEAGSLGINAGLNLKYRVTNRLFINTGVKSVNYLIAAKYQTHSIITNLGLSLNLVRKSKL